MSALNPLRQVIVVSLLLVSPNAAVYADTGGDFDLQSFHPALDSKGIVTLDRSQILGHLEPSFGLITNWASGLLKLSGGGNTYDVENMISPTLVGALGVRPFGLDMQLALAIPFHVMSGDRGPDDTMGTPNDPNDDSNYSFEGQGLGNIQAQVKWRLLNTSHSAIGLAVIAGAELPTTSDSERWLGSNGTTPYIRFAVDRSFGRLGVAANAGLRVRFAKTEFVDNTPPVFDGVAAPMTGQRIASGTSIPAGIGISYALVPEKFDIVSELFGQYAPSAENYQPLEALVGAKLYLANNSFLSLGAGAGLLPDRAGNPDWRTYLGIVFEPNVGDRDHDGIKDDVDRCPNEPEDYDKFEDSDGCPELDNDRDQILDLDDDCPNIPENRNGIDDEDGCPETSQNDRDGDLIMDNVDDCPDDPEDYDKFEDSDGCPDIDNDQDQILDVDDLCPDDAEDYDEFEDIDGCPEMDNDNDRILDEDDECPRVDGETAEETSEVWNTFEDDDGCPDRGPVTKGEGEIYVLDKILFEYDSDVIKKESFAILHAVAMTIDTNPDIQIVEVQGHTDERGSADYNKELSQRRAEAVVVFLVNDGVDKSRLRAIGYGEEQPIIRAHTPAAWTENRRVEFIIR